MTDSGQRIAPAVVIERLDARPALRQFARANEQLRRDWLPRAPALFRPSVRAARGLQSTRTTLCRAFRRWPLGFQPRRWKIVPQCLESFPWKAQIWALCETMQVPECYDRPTRRANLPRIQRRPTHTDRPVRRWNRE